jgi:hypothetical protein
MSLAAMRRCGVREFVLLFSRKLSRLRSYGSKSLTVFKQARHGSIHNRTILTSTCSGLKRCIPRLSPLGVVWWLLTALAR